MRQQYITPETTIVSIATARFIATSLTGDHIKVGLNADDNENLSRQSYSIWDEEESNGEY